MNGPTPDENKIKSQEDESGHEARYQNWKQSASRFDYFRAAFLGGVLAYVANNFVPQRFHTILSVYSLEVFSIVLLFVAFFASLFRIHFGVDISMQNYIAGYLRQDKQQRAARKRVRSTSSKSETSLMVSYICLLAGLFLLFLSRVLGAYY